MQKTQFVAQRRNRIVQKSGEAVVCPAGLFKNNIFSIVGFVTLHASVCFVSVNANVKGRVRASLRTRARGSINVRDCRARMFMAFSDYTPP